MHQAPQAKKLGSVLEIFKLVISAKKAQKVRVLDQFPCICYLVQFQKDKSKDVLTLLNPGKEINTMTLAYTA